MPFGDPRYGSSGASVAMWPHHFTPLWTPTSTATSAQGDDWTRYLGRPWAIMPNALAKIAEVMGRYPDVEARNAGQFAASGDGQRTAGNVAVLSLRGVITPRPSFLSMLFGGAGGLQSFRDDFRSAVADGNVSSILIDVDSPGGLVDLVPEVAADIREARGEKPIVAIANTRAASAAYWLASQADELVVTPSGEVGSVGVYMAHHDISAMNEKDGIATTYVSAGKYKVEGNPDAPLSDEAREHMQALVDDSYGMFVADIAKGRGTTEKAVRDDYGEGRVLTPTMALSAGMVDRVETFEQVIARLSGGKARASAEQEAVDDGDAEARADGLQIVEEIHRHEQQAGVVDAREDEPPAGREEEGEAFDLDAWLLINEPR